MDVKELKAQRAAKMAEANTLLKKATDEKRAFTTEENTTFESLVAAVEALDRQIDVALRFEARSNFNPEPSRVSGPLNAHTDPANTRGNRHSYSILKAIRQALSASKTGEWLDGIELEVHQELAKRKTLNGGAKPQGFLVPYDLPVNRGMAGNFARTYGFAAEAPDLQARAMDTTAGVGSIPTILDSTMIDLLRNRMVTVGMGATVLSDMVGLFAIPRQATASTLYWVAEGTGITDSNATIDQVTFTPHTAGAQMTYSRRFAEQTNQDAEMFVRNDITKVVAIGLDAAGLVGTGLSNQPTGVQNNTGVTTVAGGTNGLAPTWANVVGLESAVATANADMGRLGYVCNAKLRGTLKTTPQIGSTFPVFMWNTMSPGSPLNGYPVGVTNILPSNLTKGTGSNLTSLLFGNWEDLIYALWSGLDVVVDPYTGASSGAIKVVCLQDADVNLRHPESFAKTVDIIP